MLDRQLPVRGELLAGLTTEQAGLVEAVAGLTGAAARLIQPHTAHLVTAALLDLLAALRDSHQVGLALRLCAFSDCNVSRTPAWCGLSHAPWQAWRTPGRRSTGSWLWSTSQINKISSSSLGWRTPQSSKCR